LLEQELLVHKQHQLLKIQVHSIANSLHCWSVTLPLLFLFLFFFLSSGTTRTIMAPSLRLTVLFPMDAVLVALLLVHPCEAFSFAATSSRGMSMYTEVSPSTRQASPFWVKWLAPPPTATSKTQKARTTASSTTTFRRRTHTENERSVQEAETSHNMPWRSSIDPTYAGDGPYYMAFWEWQMNFMKEHLTNLRAVPTISSSGRDMSYVENTPDKMRMHTIQFQSDEYQLIRMTLLDAGNKTQVFTSLWYPDAKYNLPVLGVDFLLFNNVKHVCISDFQPIQDTEAEHDQLYEHLMAPIRAQFPTLQGKMTKRFYDENQHFSSQMLLARHDEPEQVQQMMQHELPQAFQSFLRTHVNLVKSTTPQPDRVPEIRQRHRLYDQYSSERDPAHGLLTRFFGKEFADEYVYDILFPLSKAEA
jgi:15,16-dihydrobiliverdin:ferredoxin oxidoreductase